MTKQIAIISILCLSLTACSLGIRSRLKSLTGTAASPTASVSPTTSAMASASSAAMQATTAPQSKTTITYTSSGFSPATLTIKAGDSVTFVNHATGDVQVNSDPHPTHTLYPMLNIGVITAGLSSDPVAFTKAGTYTYHNHLNPAQKGTIVVQ